MPEWLPTKDQQQIQADLMEYYFDDPIPNDAYTQGLLAGIEAMKKVILNNKNRSEPLPLIDHVQEVLLTLQKESKAAADSLIDAVTVRSKILEGTIEKGYFYPPRIKGPNDEFIGEGMSQYAAPIVRSEAEKSQMEPIMLELDSVRNALYWADYGLQQNRDKMEWIESALSDQALAELSQDITPLISVPESDHLQMMTAIRTEIERMITNDLEEAK